MSENVLLAVLRKELACRTIKLDKIDMLTLRIIENARA